MAYTSAMAPSMAEAYGMPPGHQEMMGYPSYYNQPPPPTSQPAPPTQPPYYYGQYAQPPPDPNAAQPPVAYSAPPTAYPGVSYPQPAPPPISSAPPPPLASQYGGQANPYPPQPVQPPAGAYGQPPYGVDPYAAQQYYQPEQPSYDDGGQQGYAGFGSSSQGGQDGYGDPQQQSYYRSAMSGGSGYAPSAPTQAPQPLMSVSVGRGGIGGSRGGGMDRGFRSGRVGGPSIDNRAGYGQQAGPFGSETEEITEIPDSILAKGIGQRADENLIYQFFSQCGSIKLDDTQRPKIWIYKDKSGLPKGECTVTFDDPASADYAIETCNGQVFPGSNAPMAVCRATISTPIIALPPKILGGGPMADNRGRGGFAPRGSGGGGSGAPRGFDRGRGGQSGGGPMKRSGGNTEARQGDWICNECGNNNFSFRVECNQCAAPKPDGGGGSGNGFSGGGRGSSGGRGGGPPRGGGMGRGGMGVGGQRGGPPRGGLGGGGRGMGGGSRGRGDRMGSGGGPMMRQRGGGMGGGRGRPY